MATRGKTVTFNDHFKNYVKPEDEFEVWVLGTWVHETSEAQVVFAGNQETCIAHRKASAVRSTLSIRPTGRALSS